MKDARPMLCMLDQGIPKLLRAGGACVQMSGHLWRCEGGRGGAGDLLQHKLFERCGVFLLCHLHILCHPRPRTHPAIASPHGIASHSPPLPHRIAAYPDSSHLSACMMVVRQGCRKALGEHYR